MWCWERVSDGCCSHGGGGWGGWEHPAQESHCVHKAGRVFFLITLFCSPNEMVMRIKLSHFWFKLKKKCTKVIVS